MCLLSHYEAQLYHCCEFKNRLVEGGGFAKISKTGKNGKFISRVGEVIRQKILQRNVCCAVFVMLNTVNNI